MSGVPTKGGDQIPPTERGPVPEQRTLFAADLADPRARAAVVREGAGGHGARRAVPTSDVSRARHVGIAGIAGALGVAVAAFVSPGNLSKSTGPGPLTPPHVAAKLTCEKCHGTTTVGTAEHHDNAKKACVGCHGPHPSTREGHRKATKNGELGCATCHTIHGQQQGVRFGDEGNAVRYGTDGEIVVNDVFFHAGRTVLVPIIPAKVCLGCHSNGAADPYARCEIASLAREGDHAPSVCFDEHQETLPSDATDVAGRPLPSGTRGAPTPPRQPSPSPAPPALPVKGAVCAEQHFPDRPQAWEAAREAAARVAWVGPGAGKSGSLAWLGAGALAAALGYAASRAASAIAGRTRRKPSASPIKAAERKRLPVIDTSTCLGCYACVDVCPYGVLEVERYVAVVARPDACCGLVLCEQKCPNGSLKVSEGEIIADRPRIHDSLESKDVPGLFLGGDITGLPLIKNAILQGAHAASEALGAARKRGPSSDPNVLDLCIVGAGPSGISAALRAQELGGRYAVLEQGNVAESIRSFPRGKLVFDQPLELPLTGKLWLKESSKEELLLHWMRIVRREKLAVREGERVTGIERGPDGIFSVTASPTDGGASSVLRSRTVLVAIGRRGTPRKLPFPVPAEVESQVHYHLADARSFAGARVLIAGLGDTAMEAAIALAAAGGRTATPKTPGASGISVTIVYRGATHSRGQTRNIEEIERLRKAGRLTVLFESEIAQLSSDPEARRGTLGDAGESVPHLATIRSHSPGGQSRQLPFDALFVLIGNIAPWDTLGKFGVRPVGNPEAPSGTEPSLQPIPH